MLDIMEMALRASATELNSTMPHPLDVPSSCCRDSSMIQQQAQQWNHSKTALVTLLLEAVAAQVHPAYTPC